MPLKRPSADEVAKPLKSRRSSGNPNKAKLHSVTAALKKTDTLPDSVIDMLAGMADHCLLEDKESRHEYQRSVIDMVSEALLGIQAALSEEVKKADAIVTGADSLKHQRDAALETAKAAVVAMEADLVDKKAKLVSDKEAMVAAVASLKEAETAQTQGDLELMEASGKKEKLEAALAEALNPLKEGGGDKKLLKDLEKLSKPYDIDASLMEALQRSLKKTAASRSHFDGVAVHEFEVACQKILADLAAVLQNGEPGKLERETKVQGAKAVQEAACAKHAASTTAVSEADAALKQSKADAKDADKGVHNFLSEMKEAGNDLDKKNTALQDFQEGPLANFAYLKDPPVPVEEPVVEAVVEEPVVEAAA
jgi:hypothetical protein